MVKAKDIGSPYFNIQETLSSLWNKNNPHLIIDTDNPHTISFLYADTEDLPENVREPVVSFPFYVNNVKLLRDNYSVKKRVKMLKTFYAFTTAALIIASLFLALAQGISGLLGTLPTLLLVFGSITVIGFIIFVSRLKVDKYTDDLKSPEGRRTFTPVTLHRDADCPQPCYYSGNSINNFRTHVFFGGKRNHAFLIDAELYETVKNYIAAVEEAKRQGVKDTESVSLFSDLAEFMIKYRRYVESRIAVRNNLRVEEKLSDDFLRVEESLEKGMLELMQKFNTACDVYNSADEERVTGRVKTLLNLS